MEFRTKPEIAPPVQEEYYRTLDGIYEVPLTHSANLNYRKLILRRCEVDPRFRAKIFDECSNDLIFWISTFAYALKFFEIDEKGESSTTTSKMRAFLPWPAQILLLRKIESAIKNGDSFLLEKSREVGASWMYLLVFTHFLIFKKGIQISLLSRVEDDCDSLLGDVKAYPRIINSDPATLLGKIDYVLHMCPAWMLPRLSRKRLHVINNDGGGRIDAAASGSYSLSSQRRDAIFYDEAAKNENFQSIWEQTTDVALCRLPCSTPIGRGNYFGKLRFSAQIAVETFGWWHSPEKAFDLESIESNTGIWKLTSSWYRLQCVKRSPNDISTNLDIDYLASGSPFFENHILERHKKEACRDPIWCGSIEFRAGVPDSEVRSIVLRRDLSQIVVTPNPKGPWKLWTIPAVENPRAKAGEYSKMFGLLETIFGIDTSQGMGASNSVISVLNKRLRHKIGEYAHSRKAPYQFARDIVAAALWFGSGAMRPLLVPEVNGIAGFDLMRQLTIYGYPEIYRSKTVGLVTNKDTKSLGFSSSRPKKQLLLGNLRTEYARGKYVNPSEMAIIEAGDYITTEAGAIEPATLSEENENVKAAHGDRVIADALSLWPGSEHLSSDPRPMEVNPMEHLDDAPWGSIGQRIRDKVYLHQQRGKNIADVRMGQRINVKQYL
jgi:hypothetical protein